MEPCLTDELVWWMICVTRELVTVQRLRISAAGSPTLFQRFARERDVRHVSNLLGNIIDFDESIQEASVVIRSDVSEILDCARSRYEDLDNVRLCAMLSTRLESSQTHNTLVSQVLTEVAFQIQEANPTLSSITVQYIPQVGYVVCCESPTTLPEFVFQFQEGDTTFYYKVERYSMRCIVGLASHT